MYHSHPFSLILGGGSARGIAHIGVIKRLEELHMIPSCIVGTSIGSIVGAFYACGYSSTDMENILHETNFLSLIDLDIKNGGIKGDKIIQYLKKYLGKKTFEDTDIPLKILATNIDTGEAVMLESGSIIDAIRASISIPGIFAPYTYKGITLVDGGLVANLPIEYAPPDTKVIAVSALMNTETSSRQETKHLSLEKTPFIKTYTILRKAVGIMITQNEMASLNSRKDILLIQPQCDDIEYYDFKKSDILIESGYGASGSILSFLTYS